ncbi:hypothetical protein DFH09DRAFT_349219 [Mycena vulgaris]|nr:hypothetical protein DFH09DRAFT_349219 [Mycena vulgaris]
MIPKSGDAPPAYDHTIASSSSRLVEKVPLISRAPLSPTSPSSSSSAHKSRPVQRTGWNQFQDGVEKILADVGLETKQHRVVQGLRKTVTGLIRDLVRDQTIDANAACGGILESCSEVCGAHGINISAVLQESYIEGRTPLYWAIVNRPADEAGSASSTFEVPPLIRALLTYSAPLEVATRQEIRLACLHIADQWLFQALRLCPEFQALSHKDQLLLNVQVPLDTVSIGPAARPDATFTVAFTFPQFQKRMRVSRRASLEFITHGASSACRLARACSHPTARMWKISFFVAESDPKLKEGQWVVRFGLHKNSPAASVVTYAIEISNGEAVPALALKTMFINKNTVLPDAIQYPRSPSLTPDGAFHGTITVHIKTT